MSPTILHEDAHFLVLNKPAGLNVERLHDYPSVEAWVLDHLLQQGVKKPFVGIVHRLDRPVSGVLLVALRKQALKILNEQFRERRVVKVYQALVNHPPAQAAGELQHYLGKDQRQKKATVFTRPVPGAVACRLSYATLATFPSYTLLEIRPHSGKFHQIRAQLAAAACPIWGDALYGSTQAFGLNAIALHASSLQFYDPRTAEALLVSAPPPASWPALS